MMMTFEGDVAATAGQAVHRRKRIVVRRRMTERFLEALEVKVNGLPKARLPQKVLHELHSNGPKHRRLTDQ